MKREVEENIVSGKGKVNLINVRL